MSDRPREQVASTPGDSPTEVADGDASRDDHEGTRTGAGSSVSRVRTGTRSRGGPELTQRAVNPLLGVLVLVALTAVLATVVAVGASTLSLESPGPTATFDLAVDGEDSRIAIEHGGGDAIDVDELSLAVAIDGEELDAEPPVPFVGAPGFDGAPGGPFNAESDGEWRAGQRGSFVVAETNEPTLESGDVVTVTLVVDGTEVATLEATAR